MNRHQRSNEFQKIDETNWEVKETRKRSISWNFKQVKLFQNKLTNIDIDIELPIGTA